MVLSSFGRYAVADHARIVADEQGTEGGDHIRDAGHVRSGKKGTERVHLAVDGGIDLAAEFHGDGGIPHGADAEIIQSPSTPLRQIIFHILSLFNA